MRLIPENEFRELFPEAQPQQLHRLERYAEQVREWNRRVNLVSRNDAAHLWRRHILPSIMVLKCLELPRDLWAADIGSGAGFPAIPLKILREDTQWLLIESIRKKKLFLEKTIRDLQLSGIAALNQRVEEMHRQPAYRGKFDVVTARAVGSIADLYRWAAPLLKPQGMLLLWKGASDLDEFRRCAGALGFSGEVLAVPENYHRFSEKLPHLRFLVIRAAEASGGEHR
ncbi:MAG: 16S rRNA (guanine(527)-N(7))-methyltransferase RsmG [Calditrichaeota bacterium]|nr:MAG: 16S rRNA (guanine(527)-N(7))-methyltransferase RsmG [Calditrichota bacterium]